ncbi:MAG: hypothetical protein C0403_00345 [Desulfobacterium sp.]|nr:hypothetical protein [Desulfobacterium sp.]
MIGNYFKKTQQIFSGVIKTVEHTNLDAGYKSGKTENFGQSSYSNTSIIEYSNSRILTARI